ncbi:OLC1v1012186C1 [Oldenlandia corymbosa var. corymbosa]|uniref:OLC1v1012186C1 n=1 Tax=Oldenlandia corymbosa var. corymbosa TaxID=529605 RepID=A0AAV1DX67_OLDCO|nr:OLC1v1012186C1 [Oldenlandia corymbosa var. corymbosa]
MASRVAVHQGPNPKANLGAGKQKIVQADGKNRRALRDIGNLVPVPAAGGKTRISRPATRDGKVLVNGGKPADKHNKKAIADGAPGNVRKDAVKVKPDEVTVINSDKEQVDCREEFLRNGINRAGGKSGRTYTSTLLARSKVACGMANKPNDSIVDIDAEDVNNELAVVEYVEDMYNFYKEIEECGLVKDYMGLQPDINARMRAILVDWLIEVHRKFELMPETLYLTVNIMDRFLAMKTTPRTELQLVGLASMLLACKYEEIWAPEANDFIAISHNAYVRNQLLAMEKSILRKLRWNLTIPTPYVFLVRYTKASLPYDSQVENMVFFLAELGLGNYSTAILYRPSMLAASTVYAARCTLNKTPLWTETLKHQTRYSEDQLIDCAKLLVSFHSECGAAGNKLKAAYTKYSSPDRGAVALFPPAKCLLSVKASSS